MPADPPEPTFEAPHPNGALTHDHGDHGNTSRRPHAPWEFLILMLFVALVCIGIIAGWTLVGHSSPERMATTEAVQLGQVCTDARTALQALPDNFPKTGAERVVRIRAENEILRRMVEQLRATPIREATPAAAVRGWTNDWAKVVDARDAYANALEAAKGTDKTVKFTLPANTGGLKPITLKMDDFVRENYPHLDACNTGMVALEQIEGPRVYGKATS